MGPLENGTYRCGCSNDELEENSERMKELLDWVVNNGPDLEELEEVHNYESSSVTGYMEGESPQAESSSAHTRNEEEQSAQSYSYPTRSTSTESPQVSPIRREI
jgi:hypothetical protein